MLENNRWWAVAIRAPIDVRFAFAMNRSLSVYSLSISSCSWAQRWPSVPVKLCPLNPRRSHDRYVIKKQPLGGVFVNLNFA